MTRLRLAGPADDALLRRLMRDNGMPSWVEMAIEREPSYFAAHGWHGRDWAVLAEDGDRLVGMYSAAVAPLHVNGVPAAVGYLGGLRVEAAQRHRIRHLRHGYASIRALAPVRPDLPWWYTVVAEENTAARRLLEAGVRGLPRYRPLGGLTTFAIARARGRACRQWRAARPAEVPQLLAFHAQHAAVHQLAPVLDDALVRRIGVEAFRVHETDGRIAAVAALWDQGAFKQVVARRYHPAIRWGRPLYNAYAALARRVPLPAPGRRLPQTFLAFAAFAPGLLADAAAAGAMLRGLVAQCTTPVAAIGLHPAHPLLPAVAQLAPLRYRARIYAVEFDTPAGLDGRPIQPEVALL
ncbi:MAG TPA: hypothetical protein VNB23_05235 [Ramlibacter sp.]|nr:hypothetical protein [Ramlibacter sp.]